MRNIKQYRKREINTIITALIILAVLVNLASIINAEFWECFDKGESIDYCNPATPDRICRSSNGCLYCMDRYDETRGCYNQGNFNACNTYAPTCQNNNGGESLIDTQPPILIVLSPEQDGVYNYRTIPFNISVNERSFIEYTYNQRNRWITLCRDCMGYRRSKNFHDGLNDVVLKATDSVGNSAYHNVSFFSDSRNPRIKRVSPKRGYSSGLFSILFNEANPKELILYYGNNNSGFVKSLDLNQCSLNRNDYTCQNTIDLRQYSGQEIEYWFLVRDIVGNSDESKTIKIKIDTQLPAINNIIYMLNRDEVDLIINITEENLDSVEYKDESSQRPRWIRLCSRLENNICERKIILREGIHNIDINVTDKADNSATQNIEIIIK